MRPNGRSSGETMPGFAAQTNGMAPRHDADLVPRDLPRVTLDDTDPLHSGAFFAAAKFSRVSSESIA